MDLHIDLIVTAFTAAGIASGFLAGWHAKRLDYLTRWPRRPLLRR